MRYLPILFALALIASVFTLIALPSNAPEAQQQAPTLEQWQAISDAKAPEWPKAQAKVKWRTDFKKALAEAKKSKRPLFITIRCLPCKQCSDFDKDVLEGGSELTPLLSQFITVRLTSMKDVDARVLPYQEYQDLDLSWWGYFLSDQASLYGVYGGMDEKGDSSRISAKGLAATMKRILNHHYQPERKSWKIDRPLPESKGKAHTPSTLKGWKSWSRKPGGMEYKKHGECLHCHWVNDVIRQPEIDAKRFDKSKSFYIWAYPENLGFSLERDGALMVTKVKAKSPAAKAGIKKGDEIIATGASRIFSEADLRVAINRIGYKGGQIAIVIRRKGKLSSHQVKLEEGWKKTDLGWRKSVNEAQIGAHYGFSWPLRVNANERKKRGIAKDKLAIKPWFGKGVNASKLPAMKAGLRGNDVITAVNGESPNLFGRAFGVWFRMKYDSGDTIKLTVKNPKGKERTISYKCK